MIKHVCADCAGRFHSTWSFRTHACIGDQVDPPDRDFTDAEMDEAADREVARYEATIYGEDGAA